MKIIILTFLFSVSCWADGICDLPTDVLQSLWPRVVNCATVPQGAQFKDVTIRIPNDESHPIQYLQSRFDLIAESKIKIKRFIVQFEDSSLSPDQPWVWPALPKSTVAETLQIMSPSWNLLFSNGLVQEGLKLNQFNLTNVKVDHFSSVREIPVESFNHFRFNLRRDSDGNSVIFNLSELEPFQNQIVDSLPEKLLITADVQARMSFPKIRRISQHQMIWQGLMDETLFKVFPGLELFLPSSIHADQVARSWNFPVQKSIKELNFSGLGIVAVNGLQNLQNLQYLNLSNNQIEYLPSHVFSNLNVLDINLGKNPIAEVGDEVFQNSPMIQRIVLSDAKIKTWGRNDFHSNKNLKLVQLGVQDGFRLRPDQFGSAQQSVLLMPVGRYRISQMTRKQLANRNIYVMSSSGQNLKDQIK